MSTSTTNPKLAYELCKKNRLAQFAMEWKEKHSQGRIKREATSVDHKLSNCFLSNLKLKDTIISFIVRGRLQLLQCNSLLSLYYPNTYTKQCSLCNHPSDTVSHIMNGCTKYQRLYQDRHNRIVNVIVQHIPKENDTKLIIKDTVVRPHLFGTTSQSSFLASATRPDITIIDTLKKEVFIVEISVPFDGHIDRCYVEKFDKYMPLANEINNMGFYCRIVIIIIGSLGSVHNRVVPGFKLIGILPNRAKNR